MGCSYRLSATIPVTKESAAAVAEALSKAIEDSKIDYNEFENDISEYGTTIDAFIRNSTISYGDASELDEITKRIYKQHGDHTRPLILESQCDDEYSRELFAPNLVLLNHRVEEAKSQIENLNALIAKLKDESVAVTNAGTENEFTEYSEVIAGE
jgi:hypothetical protein